MGVKRQRSVWSALLHAIPLAFLLVVTVATQGCTRKPASRLPDSLAIRRVPAAVSLDALAHGSDSLLAAPGQTYDAGRIRRALLGDLHRDLWRIPITVEVLDLDEYAGGLTVTGMSGGDQTPGLRFRGDDSVAYQFRAIVKNPQHSLPPLLRGTPLSALLNDQMAAQFPLAAMVVSELAEAVGVLAAKPRLVIMPDHPRLGAFREIFAGRMGWIEVRPEGRTEEKPGFGGAERVLDTEAMFLELVENPRSYVDAHTLLRARLLDILVGDWDRHSDQWRWAEFDDGYRRRWVPVPRDRDWAFPHIDGLIRILARPRLPQYVGFSKNYPRVARLHHAGRRIDNALLSSLDRAAFAATAADVASRLSDAALANAVAVLPPQYKPAGDTILLALRIRRDKLPRVADDLYALLARSPQLRGTMRSDSLTIVSDGQGVRIQLHALGEKVLPLFDRTFRVGETKEVRLDLLDGLDRVVIDGKDLPISVFISSSGEHTAITDKTSGQNLHIDTKVPGGEPDQGARPTTA